MPTIDVRSSPEADTPYYNYTYPLAQIFAQAKLAFPARAHHVDEVFGRDMTRLIMPHFGQSYSPRVTSEMPVDDCAEDSRKETPDGKERLRIEPRGNCKGDEENDPEDP